MKAPTLKDIAKLLNISPGTVSKALRGKPDVGENLRLAVKEAAEKINYQPNRAALSLRKAKTNTIGVVVPNLSYHFFSLALQGIEAVADANGFTVIASQSQEKYEKEINCISNMLRSGVDGIIVSLAQHTINLNHLKTALQYGVPLVQLDRITNELPNTSRVMVDNTAGAFGAVEHLIRQGCRRIGYVGGPRELDISNRRSLICHMTRNYL
jgi:LacI family transcriptional regulator